MKTNKLFLLFLLTTFLSYSQTINVTTSNYLSQLNNLSSGNTVVFSNGTYNFSASQLSLLNKSGVNNVTFKAANRHAAIIKYTGNTITRLNFSNRTNVNFEDLELNNLELYYNNTTNSTVSFVKFRGGKVTNPDTSGESKKRIWTSMSVYHGSNVTVSNCDIKWEVNADYSRGKGIRVTGGKDHKLLNNRVWGYMVMGISVITGRKDSASNVDPVVDCLIQGGSVERNSGFPDEDHGIYLHNVAGVKVDGVAFKGNWTAASSGHGIKIKGAWDIEVANCTFETPGGIILREASNWLDQNKNFWIHDNTFDNYGIGGFGLSGSKVMYGPLRIENNSIVNGGVKLVRNENSINATEPLSSQPGGVYNNCIKNGSLELHSVINQNNNAVSSCSNVGADSVVISSPSNNATVSSSFTVNATAVGAYQYLIVKVDGTRLNALDDTTSPYSFNLSGLSNGAHTVQVNGKKTDNTWVAGSVITVNVSSGGNCTPTSITPYIQVNGSWGASRSAVSVNVGANVKFGPQPSQGGSWSWIGPNGFTSNAREALVSTSIQLNQAGNYIATYTNSSGCESNQTFTITVNNNNSDDGGVLFSGVSSSGNMSSTDGSDLWYIDVPASASSMRVVLAQNSGDFDTYGRVGSAPTTSVYDWRGYTYGGEDTTTNNPAQGRHYILVDHYSGSGDYTLTVTINGGNSSRLSAAANITDDLTVYPNPVSRGQNLSLKYMSKDENNTLNISVLNVMGQTVLNRSVILSKADNVIEIAAGLLTPGVYFAKVETNEEQFLKKIVVK